MFQPLRTSHTVPGYKEKDTVLSVTVRRASGVRFDHGERKKIQSVHEIRESEGKKLTLEYVIQKADTGKSYIPGT